MPWFLRTVSRLGSSELFLLAIVATALLTAFISSAIFGLSLALNQSPNLVLLVAASWVLAAGSREAETPLAVELTNREREVLTQIADGLSNQQVADKLFISLRTVETHRLNLNQKLDVKNTAGLVKEAIKRGLID